MRGRIALLVGLAAAALPGHAAAACPVALVGGDAGSLEALLREVRARRQAALERLETPTAELVQRLRDAPAPSKDSGEPNGDVAKAQEELVALGPEAAPLLLSHLDPGADPEAPAALLGKRIAEVLVRMPSRALTDDLVRIAREGSKEGRANAVRVLSTSPDRERASACLRDVFETSTGELRAAAIASLALLGGPENERALSAALADESGLVVKEALVALTSARAAHARPEVRALTRKPALAAKVMPEILSYFRAVQPELERDDVEALVALAAESAPGENDRIKTLQAIPGLGLKLDAKAQKTFEPLLSDKNDKVREAAQICLALLGDREQRDQLLERYTDLVNRSEGWGGAYEQRASLYIKLGKYNEAIQDLKQSLRAHKDAGREPSDDLFVELARAYVLSNSLKKAYDTLADGNLSRVRLREISKDPDFRPLVEHPAYGKILDV